METKFKEIIHTTSDLKEMKGNYLAERLLRTWNEDFVDEDTGETVTIERNEIIFNKGTLITNDELSQINFYLQSKDIKEVVLSNQRRTGVAANGYTSVWSVTVRVRNKKRNYFLYANSIESALDIITDYLEQIIEGSFVFTNIKEVGHSNLIPVKEEDTTKDFYKTEVEITYEDEEPFKRTYILKAKDAEEAKESIVSFIAIQMKSENRQEHFETTIISAQKISCNNIIHYQFSKEYFENVQANNQ